MSRESGVEARVKICGITRAEDALLAFDEGAWAIGFIFHPPSPRHVEPERAREIAQALRAAASARGIAAPRLVGVFVDLQLDELQRIVDRVELDVAQLHGDETPAFAARLKSCEIWKAFRVGAGFDLSRLGAFAPPQRVLLDTYRAGLAGGTGETFDWELAVRAQAMRPIILAGGLRPENAAEALRRVRPDAIDVSSGVESAPGVKDPVRVRELFRVIRDLRAE